MIKVQLCLSNSHLSAFHPAHPHATHVYTASDNIETDLPEQVKMLNDILLKESLPAIVGASIKLKIEQIENYISSTASGEQNETIDGNISTPVADSYSLSLGGLINAGTLVLEALANKFNSQAELNNIEAENNRRVQLKSQNK